MRSIGFTFLLLATAVCICAIAVLQWREGNFDAIFGSPATPVGEHLYDSFDSEEVRQIRISSNGTKARFSRQPDGWQATAPWQDRMDPRAAIAIINFTLGMRVEDLAPNDKVQADKSGLGDNAVNIELLNEDGESLAHYKLGRVSPWKADIKDAETPVNTVFVQASDEHRKDYVYICTGDITQLFTSGLQLLRDHRPFYFNHYNLQTISIHSQKGQLTLGRKKPGQPWRIIKPLDLRTDTEAMQSLMEGLYSLQALNVRNRADVTLPATDATTKNLQISLKRFGSDEETILDVFPPESADANQTLAIVSSRPNAVLDLPIKPASGIISLADLPLDVNSLRDPHLAHLNVAGVQSITIEPVTGKKILVSKEKSQAWMATIGDETFLANELRLFDLLTAVTSTRVIGFESDAATDFSPWGLDSPILVLRFLGTDNQVLELRFGINNQGDYFVNRLGTPTVMRVDQSLIDAIAVQPYEWMHSRLWSLNRFNLNSLVRQHGDQPPLVLKYDFIEESWIALRDGQNISASLIPERANFMLSKLEGLNVWKWLSKEDSDAFVALTKPELTFTAFEKQLDENGNEIGISIRTLILAPASKPEHHGLYYGMMNQQQHPFLITGEAFKHLTVDLFDN